MPRLALRRPRGVCLPSTTPSRSKNHPRVQPASPCVHRAHYGTLLRYLKTEPAQAGLTNCARDAERRLAIASCGPSLPSYYEPLRLHPPISHLSDSRSVWWEVAPHHRHRDFARAIWRVYGRSSLPRSGTEHLAQAGSQYSRRSKIQITFLPHAVLPHLARHPLAWYAEEAWWNTD